MAERKEDQDTKRQARSTRDDESREKSWAPPDLLPMPEENEGYVYRWVRVAMMGQADTRNVSRRLREGWEPCRAEDYPELRVLADETSHWGKKGAIEVGGLLLCKAPREMREQRNKYHEEMAERQMESIDNNYMRESDPRMPVLAPERKSRSSFGGG